jgi:hypothetical protein
MLRHQHAGGAHLQYGGIFPKQAPTPTLTSTDAAIMAAEALIKALNNPLFCQMSRTYTTQLRMH